MSGKSDLINICDVEDDDVVLEGSDLHQTLANIGYTNFDLTPTVQDKNWKSLKIPKNESVALKSSKSKNQETWYNCVVKDNSFKKAAINMILEANILLDDHSMVMQELHSKIEDPTYTKFVHWLPVIGSALGTAYFGFVPKEKSIVTTLASTALLGTSLVRQLIQWRTLNKLKHMVQLQSQLHLLSRQGLKILKRTSEKKLIRGTAETSSLGGLKQNICYSLEQLMLEIFDNLSSTYFDEAKEILEILPKYQRSTCFLTNFNERDNAGQDVDSLKSLYYSYILLQSEAMLVFAHAFNGTTHQSFIFQNKLSHFIDIITSMLKNYHDELSGVLNSYKICDLHPIKRVYRGTQSKWQDVYVHLNLTSHRLQLAYKEIVYMLDYFDIYHDEFKDDVRLAEIVTEKINEAYKQIEMARSFAEFSSLLIAKVQHKNKKLEDSNSEDLFATEEKDKTIVRLDKDPEIEDEVFEEYIKEEYLKPLSEVYNNEVVKNFKLDKLLKKNFMSELKEALIEKQQLMNERELKALKRMYAKVRNSQDSKLDNTVDSVQFDDSKNVNCYSPVPPVSESTPRPRFSEFPMPKKIINHVEQDQEEQKSRTPMPLPRVKMMEPNDDSIIMERFSIKDYQNEQNLRFGAGFKMHEETFLGSGENSEEDYNLEGDDTEYDSEKFTDCKTTND